MKLIFPSLIASDILDLRTVLSQFKSECAGFHIDIMDYHFVPNLTWGPMFANAIRKETNAQLWIDLLVERPEQYIEQLHLRGGDMVTFHSESNHDENIVSHIQDHGYKAGIGISPSTPLEHIAPYLAQVDHVLLMSVEPGFSGQDFVPESPTRLQTLTTWRQTQNYTYTIAMDGGIDTQNIHELARLGANLFAVGSGIFGEQDPIRALTKLGQR